MSDIIPFPTQRRPSVVIILNPGRIRSSDPAEDGQQFYELIYYPPEHEGGCEMSVWSGTSYPDARAAALDWQADGIRVVDTIGGAA